MKAIQKLEANKNEVTTPIKGDSEEGLFLRANKKIIHVKKSDILFIESLGNYIKIVTITNEIQVREKISDFLTLLASNAFIQVHKSFIIAKAHINEIEGNRLYIGDFTIPIGKTFKANLHNFLK